ncbi:MAG TPA: ester cyclase [Nitrolancea sp.]|nr:ester cyclase [Nitrolancea sp.]
MSVEENKAIVNRVLTEVFNQKNFAVADELIASDYVLHDAANPQFRGGLEGYKQFQATYLRAFPDAHLTVNDQIAAGEEVATRWTTRGTQTGDLPGIPATGKQVTVTGITISRIGNGKITEDWQEWDQLGMLRQLGVLSTGPHGGA